MTNEERMERQMEQCCCGDIDDDMWIVLFLFIVMGSSKGVSLMELLEYSDEEFDQRYDNFVDNLNVCDAEEVVKDKLRNSKEALKRLRQNLNESDNAK